MDVATKSSVKKAEATAPAARHPFQSLRQEIDRLFEDFDRGWLPFRRSAFEAQPFWRRELTFVGTPAVDVVEKDKAFEISAELPGIDEKDVEVSVANGTLTIKGEKHEEKEEKNKDCYLSERRYGAFQRAFAVPEGVDADKIDARFKNGVLTVTLPKTPAAQKAAKKIAVKAG